MQLIKALTWGLVLACFMPVLGSQAFAQSPSPRATPTKVLRGWYENRRIMIEVTTDSAFSATQEGLRPGSPATFPAGEFFGVRIGNVIPVRINIYVVKPGEGQRRIEVDFNPLKQGRLSIDNNPDPDFTLASPLVLPKGEKPVSVPDQPKEVTLQIGDNTYETELYEVRLYVQTMRMPQPIKFATEFAYYADVVNGDKPDWKRIWTPQYIVSMSRTSDEGSDLSAGNPYPVAQKPPVQAGFGMIAFGCVCVVTVGAYFLVAIVRRRFLKVKVLDPEERAWMKIDAVCAESKVGTGYAMTDDQVSRVVGALLEYIGKPTLTSSQIASLKYEDDQGDLLIAILTPLMVGVLEGRSPTPLSPERFAKLIENIAQVIPRP